MHIDWLTVGAQVVNFLVLVWLLQKVLYRPVLDAMDRREARIARQLHEAEQREADADARAGDFQAQAADLERRRQALLDRARDEAEAERRRLLDEARAEVEQQRERWRLQLAREWEEAKATLTRQLAGAATRAARQALTDLADADLEGAMVRVFRRRLTDLSDPLRRALAADDGPVDVATAFELGADVRREIADVVREQFGRAARFVQAEEIVGGIELRSPSGRVSWTVAEYLREFDEDVAASLDDTGRAVER